MLLRILNFNIKGTLLYSRAYKIQMHTLKSCIKVMLVPELETLRCYSREQLSPRSPGNF